MTSAPAIGFEYRPSRLVGRILLGVSVLGALAVGLCGLAWEHKVVLWLGLGVGVLRAQWHWRHPAVRAAGWSADGSWSLHQAAAEDAVAQIAGFRVLGEFIVLRLRLAGRRQVALLLAPDNSDADLRRRLRMRLAAAPPGDS